MWCAKSIILHNKNSHSDHIWAKELSVIQKPKVSRNVLFLPWHALFLVTKYVELVCA